MRAAASASGNPSLKGWAFELEQIDLIRLSFESGEIYPQSVTNEKGLIFRPRLQAEFNETNVISANVENDTVIWCLKWNQGCFDVAFYMNETLITIQFTVRAKHSLNLGYVRKLRGTRTNGCSFE